MDFQMFKNVVLIIAKRVDGVKEDGGKPLNRELPRTQLVGLVWTGGWHSHDAAH